MFALINLVNEEHEMPVCFERPTETFLTGRPPAATPANHDEGVGSEERAGGRRDITGDTHQHGDMRIDLRLDPRVKRATLNRTSPVASVSGRREYRRLRHDQLDGRPARSRQRGRRAQRGHRPLDRRENHVHFRCADSSVVRTAILECSRRH